VNLETVERRLEQYDEEVSKLKVESVKLVTFRRGGCVGVQTGPLFFFVEKIVFLQGRREIDKTRTLGGGPAEKNCRG